MANKVMIFPETKLAQAEAYVAACDAHYIANFVPGSSGFGYIRPDVFGQHVTPFYGPPWSFDENLFDEPAECAALRVDGVLHDRPVLPEEE